MFKHTVYADFSSDLKDTPDWKVAELRTFEYPLKVTAVAIEPIAGLLAVGTAIGCIHVFGGPSVEVKLLLPEPTPVRFVHFSSATFQLVCLGGNSQLHIWDLAVFGRPKLVASARFDNATSLTVSPSHSHAFVALESGEVRTYDLLCLRKSEYRTPNLWSLYEEKTMATRVDPATPGSGFPVDVVAHPRDLNLLFVAYAGGVILSDLTQRNTLRAYELILPGGSPGGSGYGHPDIMQHRRPTVTSLALHPAGHYFAVGYSDGCIAFWAIEDEDQPVLVRTLDSVDVDKVDIEALEQKHEQGPEREPIYKLAWSSFSDSSDPRGGKTALTILGGLLMAPGEPIGLTVQWLPAFNPSDPPTPIPSNTSLHPFIRTAMQASLIPTMDFFYSTPSIAQDFFLVPRNSPHFANQHDPIAIIISLESAGDLRTLETRQFPPPAFLSSNDPPTDQDDPDTKSASQAVEDDLADILKDMTLNDDPRVIALPSPLSFGTTGLMHLQLCSLDRDAYEAFIGEGNTDLSLPLNGGAAWNDDSLEREIKLAKFQSPRILITFHRDPSAAIQFLDLSAQLLVTSDTPIQNHFPKPLPGLTIDLKPALTDASVVRQTSRDFVERAIVQSVHFAPQSLECLVQFVSGELVVYHLKSGSAPVPGSHEDVEDDLVLLDHVLTSEGSRYAPYFLLKGNKPVSARAISDIGFLAVAHAESLIVVDMRGPRVILRRGHDKKKARMSSLHIHAAEANPIVELHWNVSTADNDPQNRVRLLVGYASGATELLTLSRPSNVWQVEQEIKKVDGAPHPIPGGTFILDAKKGNILHATRERLAQSFNPTAPDANCILVSAGAKGARCIANLCGSRISKVEWPTKGGATVTCVQVVEKMGSQALVAFTDHQEVLAYSLPNLDLLGTFAAPTRDSTSVSCDHTGDWVSYTANKNTGKVEVMTYGTLFNFRRAYLPPNLEFLSTKPTIPPQPQPVSLGPTSLFSSWFKSGQSMTGDQLDILLGGPDRPIPQKPAPPKAQANDAASVAKSAAGVQDSLYSRLQSAMGERGQMLNDLEERFNALEEGSKNMASQAKRIAAQQTAKSWLGF
ncbi:WD40 containing SNARE-dependent exocytosis protein [Mycena indigotica]|uniref:WD40 containing SNARE-dependent exocytosis protein n=1 Tax=Mycena indigotica TaxID=2126181 RepID=A0A8H6SXZ8_9AGAR|nr:WD40 containing SNARE-dependent exocytosis protein [Mycena indigotica]KAF7307215.1 WD40 containing SNARE-dependent exocytosis protein [Mycena indigotica]